MARDIEDIHAEACCNGDSTYVDPETGYSVFTSVGLEKRGKCCGSGCRHCPYGRVSCDPKRACRDPTPVEYLPWNLGESSSASPLEMTTRTKEDDNGQGEMRKSSAVVFFSGGKDSFLSLYHARQVYSHTILLSTYDPDICMNGIQQVPLQRIREFASIHHLDLVAVPVSKETLPYTDMVEKGLQKILSSDPTVHIACLVFGDIYLEHIRQWRLHEFSTRMGYTCWFPLWKQPYDTLTSILLKACSEYKVFFVFSAIYDKNLRKRILASHSHHEQGEQEISYHECLDIIRECNNDIFGEDGEFHTMVVCLSNTKGV